MSRRNEQDGRSGGAAPLAWPQDQGTCLCLKCLKCEDDGRDWVCRTDGRFDPETFMRAYLDSEGWARNCIMFFWLDYPRHCLELIRIGTALAATDDQRAYVGAGALESLLGEHGDELIDDIEVLARKDRAFREALVHVWQHGMSDETFRRVLVASGRM